MGKFTEKQLILATVSATVLLVSGFGVLIWLDTQAIFKNEVTEQDPGASEVSDPELWGERRKIQEIKKQMDAAQIEADLMAKREQDVVVYREIVHRDAKILPEVDDVNNLAKTINDFETQSGVRLKRIGDLSVNVGGEAIKTMPVKLQLEGTFDQFLKFLNLFENQDRIINTKTFSITAGREPVGESETAEVIHDIQLDLVTYIYSPSAGLAKPVEIANYDRRKDDPVIQKLVRQQKAARVEKYQMKPRVNRRDPLLDPRRPGGADAVAGDPADLQKQRDLVDKLKFEVEVLKEDVRQEQVFIQDHKYVAYSGIKPMIDDKCGKLDAEITQATPLITLPELHEAFRDDVAVPFESIKTQRKLVQLPAVFSRRQALDFLEGMKVSMEAREYEKTAKTMGQFDALTKSQVLAEDAGEVVDEMRSLAKEAHVMIDFLALRIATSGVIIRPQGSVVIVNGKSRKAGDFVDAASRCRLKEIHPHHLLFELDGFEIEHAMGKK